MSTSRPSSVTRYRPAILVLTGAAAAYTAYLVYNVVQSSPAEGLHRSNAVRRRPRRRSAATAEVVTQTLTGDGQRTTLGSYDLFGTSIPLTTQDIVPASELREIISSSNPDASPETIESAIADVYDSFLDRLVESIFGNRAPTQIEIEAIRSWIGHRVPDNTAVTRAAQRHLQRHLGSGTVLDAVGQDDTESVAATELSWRSDEDTEGDTIDPDGQTLQRTLYHIAEDRARQEGVVHRGITCNGCDEKPIRGIRWHCANCVDFDLCSSCEATNSHYKTHIFYKIRIPAPYLGFPKLDPIYPGKPHMMSPSIDPSLKKRLVNETKMEAEEVEALWDQFTCSAGTEWIEDKSGVGWALDRRAFNHAFVPRYTSFVAAPNLIYDRIFAYFDTDKNGLIGFDEWIRGLDGIHTNDIGVKAKIIFNGYDIDGDGFVSRRDMLRILRAYYAVEKEATRNYIAELTEDLSVRNALETIRSSQPLGSAFPPSSMVPPQPPNPNLQQKQPDAEDAGGLLVRNNLTDMASREEIFESIHGRDTLSQEVSQQRRSRRQFYVDEEEGLSDLNHIQGNEQQEWGGYEIPVIETDLGKEVLYQITQQGFNELLDPLFQEKEDMAMDASETRSKRRKCTIDIDHALEEFKNKMGDLVAIYGLGYDQYASLMVQGFCKTVNGHKDASLYSYFQDGQGEFLQYTEARSKLASLFTKLEDAVVGNPDLLSLPKAKPTRMDLWNTWLYQQKLEQEILDAAMKCLHEKGWIPSPQRSSGAISNEPLSDQTTNASRDPTMPQFRPNSITDMITNQDDHDVLTPGFPLPLPYEDDDDDDDEDEEAEEQEEVLLTCSIDGSRIFVSREEGPFFALAAPCGRNPEPERENADGATSDDNAQEQNNDSLESGSRLVPSNVARLAVSEQASSARNSFFTSKAHAWYFYIDSTSEGDSMRYCAKPLVYSHDLSKMESYSDQIKALTRLIRKLALNPRSPSHITMLASLELVEQEISERKGSGLINFEEFAEMMKQGKLRFLESWMEWISI